VGVRRFGADSVDDVTVDAVPRAAPARLGFDFA
jgi:hypothetical protein